MRIRLGTLAASHQQLRAAAKQFVKLAKLKIAFSLSTYEYLYLLLCFSPRVVLISINFHDRFYKSKKATPRR